MSRQVTLAVKYGDRDLRHWVVLRVRGGNRIEKTIERAMGPEYYIHECKAILNDYCTS
jgi:hypothetical protein